MVKPSSNPAVFSGDIFDGKVFVVTGAGQGIGKGIVDSLIGLSATVVVFEHPQFVSDLTGYNVIFVDLNDHTSLKACIQQVIREYGRCDGLVNNARSGQRTAPLEETQENIAQSMSVGLTAPTILSQELIQYASQLSDRQCSIVNISSTCGHYINAESASYHATKAALESLTKYLAAYAGQYAVRVNAIAPGFIVKEENYDRFNASNNEHYRSMALSVHPLGRIGNVQDVANAVVFLLSNASSFITGQTLLVDGGHTLKDAFTQVMSI